LYIELKPGDYNFIPPEKEGFFSRFLSILKSLSSLYGGVYTIIGLSVIFYVIAIIGSLVASINFDYFLSIWASNNYKIIIALNSYYRWITAMFIHFGLIHLFLNMVGVYILGSLLEKLWNKRIVFLVFFISGILSNIASFYILKGNSGGASGGVFGLMGAAFSFFTFSSDVEPLFKNYMRQQILSVIIINVILSFILPSIDFVGHLGGLISGILLGLFIVKFRIKRNLFYLYFISLILIIVSLVLSIIDVIKLLSV